MSIRLGRSIDTIIKDYCHLLGLSQMCCSYILYCLLLHCTLSCVALHTVLSDTPFSYYVVYCSVQNPCKEWCVLASGDNDRGNGDTKTNMNNHQHHPAEGISKRFDLVSAKQMITKKMLLNRSFPSETSNHNSEPLNCDLTILCHRYRREVRKIWRSRNLTVPKPPLASAVQWAIFQWFKEFGPGIM